MEVVAGGHEPDLVVDVANVCRASELDGSFAWPNWAAFVWAVQAWTDLRSAQRVHLSAVADSGLVRTLDHTARDEYHRLVAADIVRPHSPADNLILALADGWPSAEIISMDRYLDHRNDYPWLNTGAYETLGWTADRNGRRLVPRPLAAVSSFTSDGAGSRADGRRLGEALAFWWRCKQPGDDCIWALAPWILEPPRGLPPRLKCPSCGGALTKVQQRRRTAAVRLGLCDDPDRTLTRLLLARGDQTLLGRTSHRDGDTVNGRTLAVVGFEHHDVKPEDAARISRVHLRLRCQQQPNGQLSLHVADVGSTNGTTVAVYDRPTRSFRPPRPLIPGVETRLQPRDRVILAGSVFLELSGRQWDYGQPVAYGTPDEETPYTKLATPTIVDAGHLRWDGRQFRRAV